MLPGKTPGAVAFPATGALPGVVAALLVVAVVAGAFGALMAAAAPGPWVALQAELANPLTRAIIRFTVLQAALSTLLSIALALPLARALARRVRFRGRGLLLRLTSVSFVIPSMVAALGMVAVHGRGGWVNDLRAAAGLARADYLYGLTGILLAHVFFNLPLATRIFLNELLTVPQSHWQQARLCGLRPRHIFRRIDWPLLRAVMPGTAGMIFLLCFTSFAIVLTLGGGPQSATLEVAIYQAVRFDFDLPKAVALSLLQLALCGALAVVFFAFGGAAFPLQAGEAAGSHRPDAEAPATRIIDFTVITVAALFLTSPLAASVARAASPGGWALLADAAFWRALKWTVVIAAGAGVLAVALALALADLTVTLRAGRRSRWRALGPEVISVLTLIAPPITLGAGLFLLFRRFTDALSLGPALVSALNALLALAFAARILTPALHAQRRRSDALCASLGIRGWHRWRWILWPGLRTPVVYALAVAVALAAGDMGVIALFGTDQLATLPLLIYRLLGAYRVEQAAVAAAVLCLLCAGIFIAFERLGRADA